MKNLLTLALVCLCHLAYSQKPPAKFGDVSKEDIEMTTFSADTSAAAVKLLDFGESRFVYNQNTGFTINFDRHIRVKILKKEGYEWADFEIPLYNNNGASEKVVSLKAITYNMVDGKVEETKLRKDGIFQEKVSDNLDLQKITMPDVKEGSVLEVAYTVSSEFYTELNDWAFQSTIPVLWSEYRLTIPEYFNYDKYMQGYIGLIINEESSRPTRITYTDKQRNGVTSVRTSYTSESIDLNEKVLRYAAENVPAFKPEPFITTSSDYISKIIFELAYLKYPNQPIKPILGTWDDINKIYFENENFGSQIKGNNFLKSTVEEITSGLQSNEQKIVAIFNYVKRNTAWDGTYRKFVSTPLRKVLDEKKGSSAEINFLLASMLEKAEIEVYPVLVSTRNHGFVRTNIPVAGQFNTVICMVKDNGKSILLDATSRYLAPGVLPENCLNGNGFMISKERYNWIKLESNSKSRFMVNTEFKFSEEEGFEGKITYEKNGYYAQKSRDDYFTNGEEKYVENFSKDKKWEITKSTFSEAKDADKPFKEEYEVEIKNQVTAAGNIFYLDPFIAAKMEENIFKLEKREYPVNFGSPFERLYMAKITIPEGYVVEELPQSKLLMLPENGARYIYNITQMGNDINIMSNFSINKSIFVQDEYPNLREFYNQVVAKQAEMIVIKKK